MGPGGAVVFPGSVAGCGRVAANADHALAVAVPRHDDVKAILAQAIQKPFVAWAAFAAESGEVVVLQNLDDLPLARARKLEAVLTLTDNAVVCLATG